MGPGSQEHRNFSWECILHRKKTEWCVVFGIFRVDIGSLLKKHFDNLGFPYSKIDRGLLEGISNIHIGPVFQQKLHGFRVIFRNCFCECCYSHSVRGQMIWIRISGQQELYDVRSTHVGRDYESCPAFLISYGAAPREHEKS